MRVQVALGSIDPANRGRRRALKRSLMQQPQRRKHGR
jgi:hypothetical protein